MRAPRGCQGPDTPDPSLSASLFRILDGGERAEHVPRAGIHGHPIAIDGQLVGVVADMANQDVEA
jgi:hypothetical protein